MITASEAFEKATKLSKEATEKYMEDLGQLISFAAENGLTEIIQPCVPYNVRLRLRTRGYKLSDSVGVDSLITTISWG